MNKKNKELAIHDKDTGSSELQVAQLTDKIKYLSEHLKAVNKRKKLLDYLKKKKLESYKNVISKLNLRK